MADRNDIRNDARDDVRDQHPGAGEQAGEGVGGIGGTLAGAAIGSAAGPIGSVIGGIAGALGGWWAGEKAGRALEDMGKHEDEYRRDFEASPGRDVDYDEARIGYGVGHVAGRNPDYEGRAFNDVETDLRENWAYKGRDYDTMRPYVQRGFERSSKQEGNRD